MDFMPDKNGHIEVHQETNYLIVALSYCVSVLGARTALELLGKRTSHLGAMNWFRLIGAAFSMGFVGIWTTHFIGMKACRLGDGSPQAQLGYDPWYTILSLIVPLVVLTLSFLLVGSQPQVNIKRILFGGTLAGLTVAFMHYCGQYAIKSYIIKYDLSYFIASIIIAIIASNVALYIFFRLRSKWKNQWHKKLGSALIMGIAVCGMHYTAYAGTHYFITTGQIIVNSGSISDNLLLGLNVTGSLITCAILITVVAISRNAELQRKRHAQKVVLGAAIYNENGWILVSNDGFIPIKKITNEYSQDPISRRIPYSVLFREMFALSAKQLYDSLSIPLSESGTLYDHILNTGHLKNQPTDCSSSIITSTSGKQDNIGSNIIKIVNNSKNYLKSMFIKNNNIIINNIKLQERRNDDDTKKKNDFDVPPLCISPSAPSFPSSSSTEEHFHKLGYRFTDPRLIARLMSEQIQVRPGEMLCFLEKMFVYSDSGLNCLLEPDRIYTGLFVLQKTPQGSQVLVMENSRHQIPMAKLSNICNSLNKFELDYLKRKNGMRLTDMLSQLGQTFFGGAYSPTLVPSDNSDNHSLRNSIYSNNSVNTNPKRLDLDSLRYDLAQSLHQLIHLINEENLYSNAILYPEVFTIPISTPSSSSKAGEVKFIPYSLFKNYQEILYYNSPVEMQNWKNQVNNEFGELLIKLENSRSNDNSRRNSKIDSSNKFDFNNIEMLVEESKTVEEITDNELGADDDRINKENYLNSSITISTWNKEERWFDKK
ncbi:923_t:CDS:2 [Entrophospora sp. SA101]|nr:923_t:CDS:2 [Entrophospora sp. SA101]